MAVAHANYRTPSRSVPSPSSEPSGRLRADAQVSVDVGSVVYWYARHLTPPPGVQAHLSSTRAPMGSGVPYGVAASWPHPAAPGCPRRRRRHTDERARRAGHRRRFVGSDHSDAVKLSVVERADICGLRDRGATGPLVVHPTTVATASPAAIRTRAGGGASSSRQCPSTDR
jgi:hypothetical protein